MLSEQNRSSIEIMDQEKFNSDQSLDLVDQHSQELKNETTITTNKTQKFSNLIHSFYFSNYIFIFFFTATSLVAIVQLVLFGIGNIGVNYYFDNFNPGQPDSQTFHMVYAGDGNAYMGWIILILPWIGYLFAFTAEILIVRMNKGFMKYVIIGRSMLTVYAILSGVFFAGLMYFSFMVITIYGRKFWNSDEAIEQNKATKITYIADLGFFVLFCMLFLPLNIVFINPNDHLTAIFDVISAGSGIAGWYLITKKSKWGLVIFSLSDLTFLVLYSVIQIWVAMASIVIYFLLDASSAFIWFLKDHDEKHNNIEWEIQAKA